MTPTPFLASWPSGLRQRTLRTVLLPLARLNLTGYRLARLIVQRSPFVKKYCRRYFLPVANWTVEPFQYSQNHPRTSAVITHPRQPQHALHRPRRSSATLLSYNRLDRNFRCPSPRSISVNGPPISRSSLSPNNFRPRPRNHNPPPVAQAPACPLGVPFSALYALNLSSLTHRFTGRPARRRCVWVLGSPPVY
jgi:hypothetical protein